MTGFGTICIDTTLVALIAVGGPKCCLLDPFQKFRLLNSTPVPSYATLQIAWFVIVCHYPMHFNEANAALAFKFSLQAAIPPVWNASIDQHSMQH